MGQRGEAMKKKFSPAEESALKVAHLLMGEGWPADSVTQASQSVLEILAKATKPLDPLK